MGVEFQVETLDGLDDSLKTVYVEKDGKFVLDPDKYAEHRASGLKNKNKELLGKLKEKDGKVARFAALEELEDDEIAELLKLREKAVENGNGTPANADEIAKATKQHEKAMAKLAAEKAAAEKQVADLSNENRYYKLTVPLRDIAVKAGVIAADLDLVMLDTAKRFTLSEDGKKIVVLDDDGDPATDVTPQKFFETLYKEQRPKFYQPSGSQGSGAPSVSSGGAGMRTISRTTYDQMVARGEQVDFKTTKVID